MNSTRLQPFSVFKLPVLVLVLQALGVHVHGAGDDHDHDHDHDANSTTCCSNRHNINHCSGKHSRDLHDDIYNTNSHHNDACE